MNASLSGFAERRRRALDVLVVAGWWAVAAGIVRVGVIAVRRLGLHRFVFLSPDIVWMAPLGNAVVFLVPALAIAALSAATPRAASFRDALLVFGVLGALSMLLLFGGIHPLASLVLAIGIAAQTSRVLVRQRERAVRWLARTALVMAGVVAAAGAGIHAVPALREASWRRTAALPPAGAPNVLLIVLDATRAESMSLYGYARPTTPEIAHWAAQGVVFDWAITPCSWTLPAHASMLTGRWASQLSTGWKTPLDGSVPTLAEGLRAQGYVTGGFVANPFYTGFESGLARGFGHYHEQVVSAKHVLWSATLMQTHLLSDLVRSKTPGGVLAALGRFDLSLRVEPVTDRKWGVEETAEFLAWQAHHGDRPFFAFMNYYDTHDPYDPPAPYDRMFSADPEARHLYDGAIAYVDHQVGTLLSELQRRGVLDRTIVIITSDHGEQFGEHGLRQHGNSLYMHLLHVPLVVRYPARVPAGRRIETTVSLRDLPATVLDLAGGGGDQRLPGNPLAALWDSTREAGPALAAVEGSHAAAWREPTALGPMISLVDDHWHYIRKGNGREELYAYRADSAERRNVAATPEGASAVTKYRTVIPRLLADN